MGLQFLNDLLIGYCSVGLLVMNMIVLLSLSLSLCFVFLVNISIVPFAYTSVFKKFSYTSFLKISQMAGIHSSQ